MLHSSYIHINLHFSSKDENNSCCVIFFHQATESELGDVDLSGLPEAVVDSEEDEEEDEDLERASDTLLGRDLVRECLEKDPVDRNDDDIGQSDLELFFFWSTINISLISVKISCIVMRGGLGTVCSCMSHLRSTDRYYF